MVHGPAWVGNNTFVGMKSIIFDAKVGNNVAIGISSTISNGVSIPQYEGLLPHFKEVFPSYHFSDFIK